MEIYLRAGGTRKTLGEVVAVTLVDPEDYERLNINRWALSSDGYAVRTSRKAIFETCPECGWVSKPSVVEKANSIAVHRSKKHQVLPESRYTIFLHREVLQLDPTDTRQGDHINRNRLDNRSCNLRILEAAENMQNQSGLSTFNGKPCESLYRNVYKVKKNGVWSGRWKVSVAGTYLGTFSTEELAAQAAQDYRLVHLPYAID